MDAGNQKPSRTRMDIDDAQLQALDLRVFNNGKGPYAETDSSWKNTFKPGLKFFRETVHRRTGFTNGERVLDLLCGFGRWTPFLAEENDFVIGLDQSIDCITIARNMCASLGLQNVEFINNDFTYIETFPDDYFDYVWMYSAMQYVDRGYVMPHVWRILKPGGRLFVSDYTSTGLMIEHVMKGVQNKSINQGASQWALNALVHGPDGDGNPNYCTLDICASVCERFGFRLISAAGPRTLDLSLDERESQKDDSKLMYDHYLRAIEFVAEKAVNSVNLVRAQKRRNISYRIRKMFSRWMFFLLSRIWPDKF